MVAADELLTIAELAIGLAGFSGVVVAFTHRGKLRPADRYRFIGLFTQALAVALTSFTPFIFNHAGLVGPTIWRASSGVAVLICVFNSWLLGAHVPPDLSAEETLPKYAVGSLWAVSALIVLLYLANLAGWPVEPGAVFYLLGLVLQLGIAAAFFATLVLYREGQ